MNIATEKEFIRMLCETYPFQRYIFRLPRSLTFYNVRAIIKEFFITDDKNPLVTIWIGDVYIDIPYFDFKEHTRTEIINLTMEDISLESWDALYNNNPDCGLMYGIEKQEMLINKKYKECKVINNFGKYKKEKNVE